MSRYTELPLDLPASISACLFDLDGVLTNTAKIHAAAWAMMFDTFLLERFNQTGGKYSPFDPDRDYRDYVDGKLRHDGVRSFLASRGITLEEGVVGHPPPAQTVHALRTRKDELFLEILRRDGVNVYDGARRFVEAVREAGLRRAVVSASRNCKEVLAAGGIEDLFEIRVDGLVGQREGLRGKPAPDMFLTACNTLGVTPAHSAVFEDAMAGVEAGRAGAFGWVVGVDRGGNRASLLGPRCRYSGD